MRTMMMRAARVGAALAGPACAFGSAAACDDSFESCEAIGDGFKAAVWARRHENITVLEPENDQVGRLVTALRDRNSNGAEFKALADRLMSLLVELALATVDADDAKVTTPEGYSYKGSMPFVSKDVIAVVSKGDARILAEALRRTVGNVEICEVRCEGDMKAVADAASVPSDAGSRDLVLVLEPVMATHHRCENLLEALTQRGVSPENILVVALTMAPDVADRLATIEGGKVNVVSATIEAGRDDRGFLKPGLGQFSRRYDGDATAER